MKKTKIFKVEFPDKTEYIQSANEEHLRVEYEKEYGEDVNDILAINELDEDEAKAIMLKSNEPELADEFSLWSCISDDGLFAIVGSTDWD